MKRKNNYISPASVQPCSIASLGACRDVWTIICLCTFQRGQTCVQFHIDPFQLFNCRITIYVHINKLDFDFFENWKRSKRNILFILTFHFKEFKISTQVIFSIYFLLLFHSHGFQRLSEYCFIAFAPSSVCNLCNILQTFYIPSVRFNLSYIIISHSNANL